MPEILYEVRERTAFITLNRPAALNALTSGMITELADLLPRAAADRGINAIVLRGAGDRAFCAGGDIRAIYQSFREHGSPRLDFFIAEYPVDHLLHFYPKPVVALLDGITMGGGMGLAQGSRARIVGERTRMAMPEVAIGFFPDVGGSYFLSRLPGELGTYLALTGTQIRAADALYAGLADYYLPPAGIERMPERLAAIRWPEDAGLHAHAIAEVIQQLQGVPAAESSAAPLAALRVTIDRHFAAPTIPALLNSLAAEVRPDHAEWARLTLSILRSRSPTLLAVTLEQLRRGKSMSLAACLRMELGMVHHSFQQGDFIEGVRAVIIDKDNRPLWKPPRIEEVSQASVDSFFSDPWEPETHPLSHLEGVVACS